jgi:hypothetical protein
MKELLPCPAVNFDCQLRKGNSLVFGSGRLSSCQLACGMRLGGMLRSK